MKVVLRNISLVYVLLIAFIFSASAQKNPHFYPGRSVIVHLFEWKFHDIALECERFLGPFGFGAIQLSPVHECVIAPNRPWWERYQVISYKIASRSGNEEEFADMVKRCNAAGIRIYADVVMNHMTGNVPETVGTAGTSADPIRRFYPGVPYNSSHFNPPCSLNNYNNANEVRNCELLGLHDLNHNINYVREKLVQFLNLLISHGVAGFRVDAAKHMWPADLKLIFNELNYLNTSYNFPEKSTPFIYHEVIDLGGEGISWSEYSDIGRITEFKYGVELSKVFKGNNALKWLQSFGTAWNFMPSNDAVVFIDNHDTQRNHAGGVNILSYKDTRLYKMAIAFMLSWPYGVPKLMSSFYFTDKDAGPPHDANNGILPMTINADMTCGNGWVCEQRWRQIYSMVEFHNKVKDTDVTNWWDNGHNQIGFCRGQKGFIAFNGQYGEDLKRQFNTCLPPGVYCDIISGLKRNEQCTGKSVIVYMNGTAHIDLAANEEDGILAIHVNSKLSRRK